MKKNIALLISVFTALVLEILPYGAVCNFANPEGDAFRRTYSYFDPTPFGYANFSPFIVALLTCALLILTAISLLTKKSLRTPILTVSAFSSVISPPVYPAATPSPFRKNRRCARYTILRRARQ